MPWPVSQGTQRPPPSQPRRSPSSTPLLPPILSPAPLPLPRSRVAAPQVHPASPPSSPPLPSPFLAAESQRLKYTGTGTDAYDQIPASSTVGLTLGCGFGYISPDFQQAFVGLGSSFYQKGFSCGRCIKLQVGVSRREGGWGSGAWWVAPLPDWGSSPDQDPVMPAEAHRRVV